METFKLSSISPSKFLSLLKEKKVLIVDAESTDSKEIESIFSSFINSCGYVVKANEDLSSGKVTQHEWTDITYNPKKSNTYRHSNTSQPLHTDYGYFAVEMDTIFIIGIQAAQNGGDTHFVSGNNVATYLLENHPHLFEFATKTSIRFGRGDIPFSQNEDFVLRKTKDGFKLNWNYYRVSSENSEDIKQQCNQLQEALLKLQKNKQYTKGVVLQPGQAVFFKDRYVLHGRSSFKGERKLLKGAIVTEEIEKRKKMIEQLLKKYA